MLRYLGFKMFRQKLLTHYITKCLNNRLFFLLGTVMIMLSFSSSSFATNANETSSQTTNLEHIRQQVTLQQNKIVAQKKIRQRLLNALQEQEEQINQTIRQLQQQQHQLDLLMVDIQKNKNKIKMLEENIAQQKEQLSLMIKTAYQQNLNPSFIAKLFSQHARSAERIKEYYTIFNQVKLSLLSQLKRDKQQLEYQRNILIDKQNTQQVAITQQQNKKLELEQLRTQREQTLVKLNNNLEQEQQKLETLQENAQRLSEEIANATKQAKIENQAEKELGSPKHQYPMPVKGKIIHSFNQVQIGELRWKGIVIQAPQGSEVTAIAAGKVILANWLQGYGLVVAIAHGKDDMTIYGYNQAVEVKTGDFVTAGQKIAEVGSSGGQGETALYFEIRHKGIPLNPLNWLKR